MDYRKSHINPLKGVSYVYTFIDLPYRKLVWDWEKEILLVVIKKLINQGCRCQYLDFACGTGRILSFLEGYFENCRGIDISESMLNVAAIKISRENLILGDITRQSIFVENFFDVITAFRFFLNAEQDLREEVTRELRKIIKKDGYFIFNIHMNSGCFLVKGIRVYRWLKRINGSGFNIMSIKEVKYLLENNNFRISEMYHFGLIPIYSERHKYLLKLINFFERIFSKYPLFLSFSRYIIFVCRPE